MNNNKKPVILLDILTNAKSRGAKTLKEAMNMTAESSNEVMYGSQMKPHEEYDYLMKHSHALDDYLRRTLDGNVITEDSDINYVISLLESPDYILHRDMYMILKTGTEVIMTSK